MKVKVIKSSTDMINLNSTLATISIITKKLTRISKKISVSQEMSQIKSLTIIVISIKVLKLLGSNQL